MIRMGVDAREELALLMTATKPEQLFTGDRDVDRKRYHDLAARFHPDKNASPEATALFQRINHLYDEAARKLAAGEWEGRGVVRLESKDGRAQLVQYLASYEFELGRFYVCEHHVTYLVRPVHRALYDNALAITSGFKFSSDRMREEVGRYLPAGCVPFETDKWLGLVVQKTADFLLLRDVLGHFGKAMEPKHMAWVQSSLHNLACYLAHVKLSHQAIGPDTCFVSPKLHAVALLGGWWYATPFKHRVTHVPARTLTYLPWEVRRTKLASRLTDMELIRATGRELLGDITGVKLPDLKLSAWLKTAASGDAVDNYRAWIEVLEASLGRRRFTEMKLDSATLY